MLNRVRPVLQAVLDRTVRAVLQAVLHRTAQAAPEAELQLSRMAPDGSTGRGEVAEALAHQRTENYLDGIIGVSRSTATLMTGLYAGM